MLLYGNLVFFVIAFTMGQHNGGVGVEARRLPEVRILTQRFQSDSESGTSDPEFHNTTSGGMPWDDEYYVSNKTSKILTGPSSGNRRPPYGNGGIPTDGGYYGTDLSSQGSGNTQSVQNHPSISAIDMQLLNAMEKLVGRMDAMDNRVKTVESIVHFLTSKDNKDKSPAEPQRGTCPADFVKVDGIKGKCYHVSSLGKFPTVTDWKTAAGACFKLGGRFAEILTYSDYHRIATHLVKYTNTRNSASTDFWTGGLNPGLIWIWSESGQQIDLDKRYWNENDNSSNAPGCLKLSYSVRLNTFFFKGAPCSQAQNFICEVLDNSVARALASFEKNLLSRESEEESTENDGEGS